MNEGEDGRQRSSPRNVAYGATPEAYPLVGRVLLASMAELAGDAWTPEIERAWSEAYDLVASVMLEGAAATEALAA